MSRRFAIVAALLGLLCVPVSALATFPGANGKIAFVQGGDIWAINPNGSDLVHVTSGPAEDRAPVWSPDGTTIAFSRAGDIWLVKPGSAAVQFTNTTNAEVAPAWAPDGVRLSFERQISTGSILVVARTDGPGVYTLNGRGEHSWSPDGNKVAIGSPSFDNGTPLWFSASDGSFGAFFPGNPLTDPAEGFDRSPSWSPDGTSVAYSTVRYAEEVTWISLIRADGSGVRPFTGAGSYVGGADDPSWSPDGRQIAYSFLGHIWLIGADGSHDHPITAGSEPDWQTLPPQPQPQPPVQSLPVAPTPTSVAAKDARCQRFPRIIRNTTLKMVKAQRASRGAKTRAAKRTAIKRLRKLAVQRKGYQTAFRIICR